MPADVDEKSITGLKYKNLYDNSQIISRTRERKSLLPSHGFYVIFVYDIDFSLFRPVLFAKINKFHSYSSEIFIIIDINGNLNF